MITLTCTHCRATLEMDEAFAGGACRCQHCGTIQTVPTRLKRKAMSGGSTDTKTLHVQPSRSEPVASPSSGLDELADIVASSGLTSRRLRHAPASAPEAPVIEPAKKSLAIPIAIGAIVLVLGALGVWFAMRGNSKETPAKTQATATPVVREPAFCGVKLDVPSVVSVLDRGDSTRELFGHLKEAAFRSIESLGSDRRFQVLFWNNGSDEGYPSRGTVYATRDNIQACERTFEEISAFGQTDVGSALTKAVASKPAVIVLATGKAWQLDESFTKQVLDIRGDNPIKIHTFALGDSGTATPLRDIAAKTGGEYHALTQSDLRTAGQ
jgi:hypothetical protein